MTVTGSLWEGWSHNLDGKNRTRPRLWDTTRWRKVPMEKLDESDTVGFDPTRDEESTGETW